jgi:CHAD domain-containing protein
VVSDRESVPPDEDAIRLRAYELSQQGGAGTAAENWLRAEQELAVVHDYDTIDRDLEQLGMTISRLPLEAGVVWRLRLPRGEVVEEWEPGNAGLTLPGEIARLVARVVAGKPLIPGPPLSHEPGALRLREMLEEQRRTLVTHDPGSRLGIDPENLHQHRVAARRTRAFLHATRAFVEPEWRRLLTLPLRELGEVTGPVRDLDVLLEHVREELGELPERDQPGGRSLVERLEHERFERRHALLAALDGDRYRLLLARLRLPPRLAPGVERVRLERVARAEFRRLARAVDRLGKRPSDPEMHGLRIKLKRARYAAELASPHGSATRKFVDDAKALQDLLGEYQDAFVAEERLRSSTVVDEQTATAFVAGRLAERQVARRLRVRAALPDTWKRLRRRGARLG